MPTYNRAHFVKYAIDSALNQTYKNIEVIVVDDGSTDNTKEICAQYGSKIRYFHKQNEGMVVASNYGINMMKGSWLKWLADDDILPPEAVQVLIENTDNGKHPVVCADYEIIDDQGTTLGIWPNKHFDNYYDLALALWLEKIAIFGTTLIHRSCFEIVGKFNPNYGTAFDYEWFLRASFLHNYMFYYIPRALYKLRLHKQQAAMIHSSKSLAWVKQARNDIEEQAKIVNPETWQSFCLYKKQNTDPFRQGFLNGIKMILRRANRHLPHRLRNYGRRLWHKRIRSLREVTCEVCENIYDRKSLCYLRPDANFITCQNCGTCYNSENLRRLIGNQIS